MRAPAVAVGGDGGRPNADADHYEEEWEEDPYAYYDDYEYFYHGVFPPGMDRQMPIADAQLLWMWEDWDPLSYKQAQGRQGRRGRGPVTQRPAGQYAGHQPRAWHERRRAAHVAHGQWHERQRAEPRVEALARREARLAVAPVPESTGCGAV